MTLVTFMTFMTLNIYITGPGSKVRLKNLHLLTEVLVWRLLQFWSLKILSRIENFLNSHSL